jgi:peptide/nickel transport system substrate-binding protein
MLIRPSGSSDSMPAVGAGVHKRGSSAGREVLGGALSRRQVLASAGFLAGAAALVGCSSSGGYGQSGQTAAGPDTLTWALAQDPDYLIPMGSTGLSIEVTYYIYESLLRWDANFNQLPSLATSWEQPNATTYIFHLREGVRFHSGKLLDAEDVKYSIEMAANPPAPGANQGFFPPINKVTVLNKSTVQIQTSQPAESILGFFAWGRYCEIVPAGLYTTLDVRTQTDGTGPFKLVDYVPNDHITLARNPHYWQPGVPSVDQLVLKILPDEGERLDALRSGAIDGGDFSYDSALVAKGDRSLRVNKVKSMAPYELEFTLKDKTKPWNDVRVRQAVNHAINRQNIIDLVFSGQGYYSGKILQGFGNWAIPESQLRSNYERYDLSTARALLAAAGYKDGFPVTLNSIAQPAAYTDVATVVKAQLAEVGIDVTLQPQDIATFDVNDTAGTFEWESTGRGMRGDVSEFFSDFDPSGSTYNAWYAGGWSDPALWNLMKTGLATANVAQRMNIYRQAEQIVLTTWPEMPLVSAYIFEITGSRVRGSIPPANPGWDTGLQNVSV